MPLMDNSQLNLMCVSNTYIFMWIPSSNDHCLFLNSLDFSPREETIRKPKQTLHQEPFPWTPKGSLDKIKIMIYNLTRLGAFSALSLYKHDIFSVSCFAPRLDRSFLLNLLGTLQILIWTFQTTGAYRVWSFHSSVQKGFISVQIKNL